MGRRCWWRRGREGKRKKEKGKRKKEKGKRKKEKARYPMTRGMNALCPKK
jgi:hypothetical protein